jgi:hypothetical protein
MALQMKTKLSVSGGGICDKTNPEVEVINVRVANSSFGKAYRINHSTLNCFGP